MALTTFGAIMGFAAEMAAQAEEIYKALAGMAKAPALKEFLEALSKEEAKNRALMIKARRENVTEMILEPVTGLNREDYEVDVKPSGSMEDGGVLNAALILEERGKAFFENAASKVPIPEVARTFRKAARKKEENLIKLRGFGLDQSLGRRS